MTGKRINSRKEKEARRAERKKLLDSIPVQKGICERCFSAEEGGQVIIACEPDKYLKVARRWCAQCVTDWWLKPVEEFPWQAGDTSGPYTLAQCLELVKGGKTAVLVSPTWPGAKEAAEQLATASRLRVNNVQIPIKG